MSRTKLCEEIEILDISVRVTCTKRSRIIAIEFCIRHVMHQMRYLHYFSVNYIYIYIERVKVQTENALHNILLTLISCWHGQLINVDDTGISCGPQCASVRLPCNNMHCTI